MAIDLKRMQEIFAEELAKVREPRALKIIRKLAVEPVQVRRVWDYGAPGSYLCWTVLEHPKSGTAIVYCEEGFGPRCPWGLMFMDATNSSMGMDSGWFSSLEDALKDSFAWEDGV